MVSKIRPNVWPFVSKGPDLQTHWPGPWIYLVQWRYTMFFFGKEKKSGTQAVRGAPRNFSSPEQTVVHYEYAMTKSNLSTGPVQGQYAKQYIDCTNTVHDWFKYSLGTEAVRDRVPTTRRRCPVHGRDGVSTSPGSVHGGYVSSTGVVQHRAVPILYQLCSRLFFDRAADR